MSKSFGFEPSLCPVCGLGHVGRCSAALEEARVLGDDSGRKMKIDLKAAIEDSMARAAEAKSRPGTPRGAVLEEARTLTEGDRNKTHGDILTNHQAIADAWNWWLHHRGLLGNGEGLTVLPSDVAEMMSLLKKARKVSGHAAHHDHGVDDCAYSAIAQELRETGN